ncbi:hypothetical protein GHK52_05820 [Lactococcus garvieae]|nr:hypothetical protein [Lactococcus garvieae]
MNNVTIEQWEQSFEGVRLLFGGLFLIGCLLAAFIIVAFQQRILMNDIKRIENIVLRTGFTSKMGFKDIRNLKEFSKAINKERKELEKKGNYESKRN